MNKALDRLYELYLLFYVGGISYILVELLYRQHSHWTMFIVGGLCFLAVGAINELIPWNMSLTVQGLIGAVAITVIEFIAGCVINLYFHLNVWDYSNLPFNILGQVCLLFYFLWVPISIVAVVLDDYLRFWRKQKDTKPTYKLF